MLGWAAFELDLIGDTRLWYASNLSEYQAKNILLLDLLTLGKPELFKKLVGISPRLSQLEKINATLLIAVKKLSEVAVGGVINTAGNE
eukprot:2567737-Prymnesium_polylepis.1